MTETARSKNNVPIRLTDERWTHIVEEHNELAGFRLEVLECITNPWKILSGKQGEQLAVQEIVSGKYLVVVYKEELEDGFIITAFFTRRKNMLERRKQLWP